MLSIMSCRLSSSNDASFPIQCSHFRSLLMVRHAGFRAAATVRHAEATFQRTTGSTRSASATPRAPVRAAPRHTTRCARCTLHAARQCRSPLVLCCPNWAGCDDWDLRIHHPTLAEGQKRGGRLAGGFINPDWLRYSEVIHARWAMLGAAGIIAPEVLANTGVIPQSPEEVRPPCRRPTAQRSGTILWPCHAWQFSTAVYWLAFGWSRGLSSQAGSQLGCPCTPS